MEYKLTALLLSSIFCSSLLGLVLCKEGLAGSKNREDRMVDVGSYPAQLVHMGQPCCSSSRTFAGLEGVTQPTNGSLFTRKPLAYLEQGELRVTW